MFTEFVPHHFIQYNIDSNLIALGNTTWQTKNVTSVTVDKQTAKLEIDEPVPSHQPPEREVRSGFFAIAIVLSWTYALSFAKPSYVGWPLTLLSAAGVWFIAHYAHKHRFSIWKGRHDRIAAQQRVWRELAANPPEFFSLIIESSSGKSVALTTLDIRPVAQIHSAILNAMRGSDLASIENSIDVVNMGNESPDSFFTKYCNKIILKA